MSFDIIYARDILKLAKIKNAIIIDIREKKEYEAEHLENAINIPYENEKVYEKMLSKRRYYILYCDRGGSSMKIARYLGRMGYKVATVIGGYDSIEKFVGK